MPVDCLTKKMDVTDSTGINSVKFLWMIMDGLWDPDTDIGE